MSAHPRIAVTGVVRCYDGADRTGVNAAYTRAVLAAGGLPLILPSLTPGDAADAILEAIDGVVFTGGEDVGPDRYGTERHALTGVADAQRDSFELALFAAARRRGVPILGICRGMQLINVALGGTLWQDLPSEHPGSVDHSPKTERNKRTHLVTLEPPSDVATALGCDRLMVNSVHHQAVRRLGSSLRAVGWSEDGLIEAAESADGSWILAVQWHPEEMYNQAAAPDQGLFAALIKAASTAVSRFPGHAASARGR